MCCASPALRIISTEKTECSHRCMTDMLMYLRRYVVRFLCMCLHYFIVEHCEVYGNGVIKEESDSR